MIYNNTEVGKLARKKKQSCIVVRDLFDTKIHHEISKYVKDNMKFLPLERDDSLFMRLSAHNVGYFRHIHDQLKDYASEMFKEKVKPSYSFVSMYKDGGRCPLHIDRSQCRYTIDYLIDKSNDETWTIKISDEFSDDERIQYLSNEAYQANDEDFTNIIINNNNWTEVNLNPNDAVLYSGTHSWHYRPEVLKGEANLVFFHFVPEDFNGPLE